MHINFFRIANDETALQKLGFKRFPDWDTDITEMWRLDKDGRTWAAKVQRDNGPSYVQLTEVILKGNSFLTKGAFGWKDCCSEGSIEKHLGIDPLKLEWANTPHPVVDSSTDAP